jgi:DNA-directed RNA polymerase specialized sigma54-like protein
METIKTIKTPRGTFNVKAIFKSESEANDNGFYYYFTNDDGIGICTKVIGEVSKNIRYIATIER